MFKKLFVIIIISVVLYIALDSLVWAMFKPQEDILASASVKLDLQKQQADKAVIIAVVVIFCFLVLIASWFWVKSV